MLQLTLRDGEGVEMRQGGKLLGFVRVTRDAGRNRVQIDLPDIRIIRKKRNEIKERFEEPPHQPRRERPDQVEPEDFPLCPGHICEGCLSDSDDN